MSNLTVVNHEGNYVVDSREVAQMIRKRHDNLIRDIKGYVDILENSKLSSQDFFIKDTYKTTGNNKTYECYLLTKKGCDMVANKMTGEKGVLFTATYVTKFEEMEKQLKEEPKKIEKTDEEKKLLAEAKMKNAKARIANTYLKMADNDAMPKEFKQIMFSYASKELAGEEILPLPKSERKTYTATEIGKILGISSNKVGKVANEHKLKTEKYGINVWDKAKHCDKQVPTFRYYDTVITVIKNLI